MSAKGWVVYFKSNDPNILAPEKLNKLTPKELLDYSKLGSLRLFYAPDAQARENIHTLKDALEMMKAGTVKEIKSGMTAALDDFEQARQDQQAALNKIQRSQDLKGISYQAVDENYQRLADIEDLNMFPGNELVGP